jgi:hypothetical protein
VPNHVGGRFVGYVGTAIDLTEVGSTAPVYETLDAALDG